MKTQLDYFGTASSALLSAEEVLLYAGAADLAQAARNVADKVRAATWAVIDSLDAPADPFERRAQLRAAIKLEGVSSALVARAARRFADAADDVA